MAGHQNRLSRFWQELKRRRVIHVITVYATASFAIIEVIGNLSEPLNLPTSLSTIVIIVLAVGFPPAIILSWLYDLTSGTFERTKPQDETEEEIKPVVVPNAWKIATYVSFIVIVGLVVLNIASRSSLIKPGMVQSLAILPFDNYTGDENLEYFVSGMHSSLINDMGKVSGLRVLSETTSKLYKNADKSIPQIASELGVDAVVEAQVLCIGDTICLQIRVLTAGPEEKQLWIGDYREDKSKILSLYNRVTKQIADEVKVELTPEEERLLSKSRIVDREAYDSYLMGLYFLDDFSEDALNKALENLNNAIDKDPDWAPLYAGLAKAWIGIAQVGFESPSVAYQNVYKNLEKAISLDPDLSGAHFISGMSAYLNEWDWSKGERELLKALAINPNDVMSRIYYAQLLGILQRPDEAREQGELAIGLDPLNPLIQILYSALLLELDDCQAALTQMNKVLDVDPGNFIANSVVELAAYRCEDYDKTLDAARIVFTPNFIEEDTFEEIERIFTVHGFVAAYEDLMSHLEILAQNSPIPPVDMAIRYVYANLPEKAIDWLEKGLEQRDPNMPYIATHGYNLDPLFNNPRFIAICEEMKLPLPKSD